MLKYLTHKLRTQSINEDNLSEKVDGHDSGTESDGDLEKDDEHMEFSCTRQDTTSPSDTVYSSESPGFLEVIHVNKCPMYDQHSSEEELEVINGPSNESEPYQTPKRSNSTVQNENRKRSLAQSSDDEARNQIDYVSAPVNFRTSPPLEALKPHRSDQRPTTPLILTETSRRIESIRISCDSPIQMDVRSISPPAKLFHCEVSPRRRPPRHILQKFQRPHRPCLDFDKMQQLKARPASVTAWRHHNEHTGELSIFCW